MTSLGGSGHLCAKGIGIWRKASNDDGVEPDVVMASCGDVATQEALAATAILANAYRI